jgi:hypothetical protein
LPTNYVLIDYENIQPKNFEKLKNYPFKIFLFVGENQTKVPFDLASVLQTFGANAQYIKISGNGPNSLDFHIAYYIGQLSSKDPQAHFHIISKDTGFDPLIKHLRTKRIRVSRVKDLGEIPILRMSNSTCNGEKIAAIIKNLSGRGQSRPRKTKTLANTINSLFTEKLDEKELTDIIARLQEQKYIKVAEGNVTYKLPRLS